MPCQCTSTNLSFMATRRSLQRTVATAFCIYLLFQLPIYVSAQERPTDTGRRCKAGTYDTGNYCCECPEGTFTTGTNNFVCKPCRSGLFSNAAKTGCTPCPRGSHLAAPNKCAKCPTATYSDTTSASSCKKCPPGTSTFAVGAASRAACRSCRLGQYISNYISGVAAECKDCVPTMYGDKLGSCKPCPAGTFTGEFGRSKCRKCPPGTHSGAKPDVAFVAYYGTCPKCPDGMYNVNSGASKCKRCPDHTTSTDAGTGCVVMCPEGVTRHARGSPCAQLCNPGFARASRGAPCRRCPPGKVGLPDAVTPCAPCPATFVPNAERSACVCPRGSVENGEGRCQRCAFPSVARDGECACDPPNMQTADGCACPALTTRKGNKCVACSAQRILKAIETGDRAACSLCGMNERFDAESGKCLQCPPGLGLLPGQGGRCRKCARPWVDAMGVRRCGCRPGTVQRKFACVPCAAGSASDDGAECGRCDWGYFADAAGLAQCKRCPVGRRYSQHYGDVQCPPACPAYSTGSFEADLAAPQCFCNADTTVPVRCAGGVCAPAGCDCRPGYELRRGQCRRCAAGTASDGKKGCRTCPTHFVPGYEQTGCRKCLVELGHLAWRPGQAACKSCDLDAIGVSGRFLNLRGNCARCRSGYRVRNGECVKCVGSVSNGGNVGYCRVCRNGTRPNRQLSSCV